MMVTKDEYELPLVIADTAKELAAKTGYSENNIRSTISHYESGRHKKVKFYKIRIDEDENGN